jgi:hypothetical protein
VRRAALRALAACALALALVPATAHAHRLAPALLELIERGEGRVDVRFKLPIEQPAGSDLRPELPPQCVALSQPAAAQEDTGLVYRWSVRCDAGLVGARVALAGLAESGSNALLRIELADGRHLSAVLYDGAPSFDVPARQGAQDVARAYLRLGFLHILTGFDHLLFVFGLLLLVGGGRPLFFTVTAFTLGHSVTLSLAALGYVHFPSAWIEVVIAGTILLLAAELGRPDPDPHDAMRRAPWLVAGGFGLLHGLGFAGALAEVGLPQDEIPLALASFNVGIELGQLAFVFGVLAAWRVLARPLANAPAWLARVPATAMGALAAYWCLQRGATALGL